MKCFIVAAALAVTGALGFTSKADAQMYVNTYSPGGGVVVSSGYGYPGWNGAYNYPSYNWMYNNPSYSYWYSASRYPVGYWPGGYFGGYPYYNTRYGGYPYGGYRYGGWGRRWR